MNYSSQRVLEQSSSPKNLFSHQSFLMSTLWFWWLVWGFWLWCVLFSFVGVCVDFFFFIIPKHFAKECFFWLLQDDEYLVFFVLTPETIESQPAPSSPAYC